MKTIICNKCGKPITKNESYNTIKLNFGYGSQYDEQSVEMDFHEECTDKIFIEISNSCVIKPELDC